MSLFGLFFINPLPIFLWIQRLCLFYLLIYHTYLFHKKCRLDCGIFVIHFANQLHEGKPIQSTFQKEEVFLKRASIVTTLVNHPHSYPYGLKRLPEEKKVARKYDYIDELFGDDDD